jgi:hypothetical protein
MTPDPDEYDDKTAEKRMNDALRRALQTPPVKHKAEKPEKANPGKRTGALPGKRGASKSKE